MKRLKLNMSGLLIGILLVLQILRTYNIVSFLSNEHNVVKAITACQVLTWARLAGKTYRECTNYLNPFPPKSVQPVYVKQLTQLVCLVITPLLPKTMCSIV